MKTNSLVVVLFMFFTVITGWCGIPPQTFTITPSSISNTYTGVITLDITGLTNTEQVAVQTYLDLNGNGSVDANDPLIDAFKIRDGGAMIIGGITNLNAPYDRNGTIGTIRTTLGIVPAQIMDNIVGKHIFRVVSPTGRFSTLQAVLTVTNGTLSQSISGIIYSNGVPTPYAVVVAQDQAINNPVAGVIADASGHYFLTLPASSYGLIGTVFGCVFDFNSSPMVILTNGMSATNDLNVTAGTTTISGNIYDAANSNGIGGLLMTFESGSDFAIGFSDANGNYNIPVSPSFWKIKPSRERLARRAYVASTANFQVDTSSNAVTGADIPLYKGTALFYGRVTDNSSNFFSNVEVDGGANGDNGLSLSGKGYSDTNGYYTVAILGDITNLWNCQANDGKNASFLNYIVNSFPTQTFSTNESQLNDFIGLPATAVISGNVQDNLGANVVGVTMQANTLINGLNYQALESTLDNSGNYSFAVASGTWQIEFLTGGFDDNLDTHGYVDLNQPHFVTIPPTNVVYNITVYPLGTPLMGAPVSFPPHQIGFNLFGASNVNYTVQFSTNLASGWNTLLSLQMTNNSMFITDQNATNGVRFYRVQKN